VLAIGHENYVSKSKVSGIYNVKSNPIRKIIDFARTQNVLIDATKGKATKSVIVLSDGFVILSSMTPQTLAEKRFS